MALVVPFAPMLPPPAARSCRKGQARPGRNPAGCGFAQLAMPERDDAREMRAA